MPALVIPQILLCGLFVPADRAAGRPRGGQRRAAAVLRRRRDADTSPARPTPATSGATSRSSRRTPSPGWPSAPPPCAGGAPDPRSTRGIGEAAPEGARRSLSGMRPLRQPLLLLARSEPVKKLVSTMPVSAGIVRSYVPGETTEDAVDATAELAERRPQRHARLPRRGHPRRRAGRGHGRGVPRRAPAALGRRA